MIDLLKKFWTWANISPEEYAKNGIAYESEKVEFYYPFFDKLLDYVKQIIHKTFLSAEELDDVLTIMALDNETETILNYFEKNLTSNQLKLLVEAGLHHLQPEARWQVAELIYRRKPKHYEEYLIQLADDSHEYVRRRAANCLKYLRML